jgi:hypothetical protein
MSTDRIEKRVVLRAQAFRMNTEGWGGQIKNLERYVS